MTSTGSRKISVGKRCVAFGCSSQSSDGISLHLFPLNKPNICRQWTQFVRRKRVWDGPSRFSALCERHFDPSAYPLKYQILKSMDQTPPKKKRLNDDAVPTIQTIRPILSELELEKNTPSTRPKTQSKGSSTDRSLTPPLHSTPKTKKWRSKSFDSVFLGRSSENEDSKAIRTAYLKRENSRIIQDYDDAQNKCFGPLDEMDLSSIDEHMETEIPNTDHTILETPVTSKACESRGTQLSFKRPIFRSVRVQVKPLQMNKGCQANIKIVKSRSVSVQCDLLKPNKMPLIKPNIEEPVYVSDSSYSDPLDDPTDESFHLESESESDNSADVTFDDENRLNGERLFIVSEGCLMTLFQVCPICSSASFGQVTQVMGTMIKIEQDCGVCGHNRMWWSQTLVGSIPEGNLKMSCAVLYSGSLPAKSLRLFDFMNIPAICYGTFMKHQRFYLQPAIVSVWNNHQSSYIHTIQESGDSICIGGDGRCDTPGHSAKFGSYSVMDLDKKLMLDVQLVQSNEVESSSHMEKEGLARSVAFLKSHGITVNTIVTDRHVQIRKWVRENMFGTKHCIDVWHVAKGLKKKLFALSKEKNCSEVTEWIKSITNHLYWVAASTPSSDKVVMKEKWESLGNHIQNIHEGHGEHFPKCLHGDLEDAERKKKWLKPGTKSLEKLLLLLDTRQMKIDIPMLSTNQQTSEIEGYHSVINHFAPKMYGFSFNGMRCRLLLAALHYNENGGRDPARTQDGETRVNIVYPKYKKGNYTVREMKVDATYKYVQELLLTTVDMVKNHERNSFISPPVPPPLCEKYTKPSKEEAITSLQSRFRN